MQPLQLLTHDELALRLTRLRRLMADASVDAMLITDHANQYYLTGRVFEGYVWVDTQTIRYFIRRPIELDGDGVTYIRKPEDIAAHIGTLPARTGLELDLLTYSLIVRLQRALPCTEIVNADPVMRAARAVKTPFEQQKMRQCGIRHVSVYRRIPGLYRQGMTDIELQIEIEHLSRLEGCLGLFRINGTSMEHFMGNVICGDNADAPSPYDFAMGGAGMDPSLPAGADGTALRPGMTVMVDMNGNFNGYMTDLTRVYAVGDISDLARRAHLCSIRIHRELAGMARPGTEAKALYHHAAAIVADEGLEAYYMGHRQHAGFIGHGVGIEINEAPVIAPRSRDILEAGNAIALEPKFVIPHVGAVGIENTYIVTHDGLDNITDCPTDIIQLD